MRPSATAMAATHSPAESHRRARRPARAPRLPPGVRAAASSVTQNDEGAYVVEGEGVEKLVARYDLDNEDALAHLERRLRGLGVIRALEAAGFEPGDDVEIGGVVFELDP